MVIDSTDRERLAVTRDELYRMLQHEDLSKASLLVFANKQVCTLGSNFHRVLGSTLNRVLSPTLNET